MNKEIEEIARIICITRSDIWNTCEECLEYNNMTRCYCHEYAEALINEGYHKMIWHKVADGDLPKPENGNVIAIPVQACYTNKMGIKVNGPCCFFFIDNTFRSLNMEKTLNVIAWTELPIYEVNKV